MGDGAADRAFVAGLEMSDERQSAGNERELSYKGRPTKQAALRHCGADLHLGVIFADRGEFRNAGDVDEDRGLDDPEIEHGQERLPAREDARIIAMLGQDIERLLHRVRSDIVEWARLHATALEV